LKFSDNTEFEDYNVMENFRDAKFSGTDNKILTFPENSYPVKGMDYEFLEEMGSKSSFLL